MIAINESMTRCQIHSFNLDELVKIINPSPIFKQWNGLNASTSNYHYVNQEGQHFICAQMDASAFNPMMNINDTS